MVRPLWPLALAISLQPFAMLACSHGATAPKASARNLVLITIDTLRADHVGAYGYARARTSTLDRIAAGGALFEHAFAAAPITLTSHATMLSGRYPPGHGARDNGLRISDGVPTLATELHAKGFATAAFVAAFPLDHQFGLDRGFDVYGDRLPRGADGRLANERPASVVVNDAIAWLQQIAPNPKSPVPSSQRPFFLWVHMFEPHAPYGDPSSTRPVLDRYDEEIATADAEAGRLIAALGAAAQSTLVVIAGDHGEAFGEHGEYAHSIFVYDTTLRVPLLMSGPGIPAGTRVTDSVTLADIAPTVTRAVGSTLRDADGIDLSPAFSGTPLPQRELYAESFAPLVEFGWAPLRAVRAAGWKAIAAPKPELFDLSHDPREDANLVASKADMAAPLLARADHYSPGALRENRAAVGGEAAERLRALGYTAQSANPNLQSAGARPDPKDRREMAARIAQVTSGELWGPSLLDALEGIVRDDPRNGQAQLRLGYARLQSGDCARAEPAFHAAAAAGLPSADIYTGLATCLGRRNDLAAAGRALAEALRIEPDNPAVIANIGLLQSAKGELPAAIQSFTKALEIDPGLHEARFRLAVTYAKAGRMADAASTARDLLARLPPNAPQRPEVERLLKAVQPR